MATTRDLSRRAFLRASIGIAGVGLLAACAPQPPATAPTAAATPAGAPTPAAPAPTAAPAAKPTVAAGPTAAPTPVAAAPKPAEKVGRNLIGKLEGQRLSEKGAERRPGQASGH